MQQEPFFDMMDQFVKVLMQKIYRTTHFHVVNPVGPPSMSYIPPASVNSALQATHHANSLLGGKKSTRRDRGAARATVSVVRLLFSRGRNEASVVPPFIDILCKEELRTDPH